MAATWSFGLPSASSVWSSAFFVGRVSGLSSQFITEGFSTRFFVSRQTTL